VAEMETDGLGGQNTGCTRHAMCDRSARVLSLAFSKNATPSSS
jgi:hypothetical protein